MSITTPTPFQYELLRLPEDINLFLGGGRGGGKSHGAGLLVLKHCAKYGKLAKVLVCRNQHKANADFENLIENLFIEAYGSKGYVRNRQEHSIRALTGASVEFSDITPVSYQKFQGRQFSLLLIDEAGEFHSLLYVDKLQSNLRQPGVPLRTIMISNPGGLQHVTLSKRYVNGRVPWRMFSIKEEPWIYCPSRLTDNTHLDHDSYTRKIIAAAGNDEALAKAWITGDWSAISGAFFSDALSSEMWIDDGWLPPHGPSYETGWHTGIAIDWGYSAPSVCYFWARPGWAGLKGPNGRTYPQDSLIILDELAVVDANDPNVGLGWGPQMLAEAVLEKCARLNVRPQGPCDDARGLEGTTLLQQLRQYGLTCTRPMKDRISGWTKMKSMMMVAAKYDGETPIAGPGLWVHDRCRYFAETIATIPRNKLRMEDCDSSGPDHGADAMRYACNHEPAVAYVGGGVSIY